MSPFPPVPIALGNVRVRLETTRLHYVTVTERETVRLYTTYIDRKYVLEFSWEEGVGDMPRDFYLPLLIS